MSYVSLESAASSVDTEKKQALNFLLSPNLSSAWRAAEQKKLQEMKMIWMCLPIIFGCAAVVVTVRIRMVVVVGGSVVCIVACGISKARKNMFKI